LCGIHDLFQPFARLKPLFFAALAGTATVLMMPCGTRVSETAKTGGLPLNRAYTDGDLPTFSVKSWDISGNPPVTRYSFFFVP